MVVFRRLFNIYAGEEKNAFLFAILGFVWALGVTAGLKFADALFLLHVGAASLPVAYGLTACIMIVLATLLLKLSNTVPIHRIFIGSLCAGIIFYSGVYFCFTSNIGVESKWLWYALKVFGSLLFTISVTCFWSFIDEYYHLQDAKRLYSVFMSAVFLGFATTGFIMRSGWIDFQNLTVVIIVLYLFASYWTQKIVKTLQPVYDENVLETSGEHGEHAFSYLFQSIFQSKFTLLLMTGNFLAYLLLVVTEYSYLSAFDAYFDPGILASAGGEENAPLTQFLGQCIAVVSIFNLLFGLFVYSRLIRRFGLNNLILFTPTFLFITYSGWNLSTSLLFPLMGFFVVEGLLYCMDDNNFTLLLNAVPTKLKYRIRVIIESFFEPIGMLTSSLLITFVPINSIILGLILTSLALIVAFTLRSKYLKAIYLTLSEHAIHFQRTTRDWLQVMSNKQQEAIKRRLLAMLQVGDEQAQLLAVEGLIESEDPAILPKLLARIDHLSNSGKVIFLQRIAKSPFATDPQFIDHLFTWMYSSESKELTHAIHFYLAKEGLLPQDQVLQDLQSSDLNLKSAAVIALQHTWPTHLQAYQPQAQEEVLRLLRSNESDICMALAVLGSQKMKENIPIIAPFLKRESIKIVRCAILAIEQIASTDTREHAKMLLDLLKSNSDPEVRQATIRALGKLQDPSLVDEIILSSIHFRPNERRLVESVIKSFGTQVTDKLLEITKNTALNDSSRLLAGRVLGRMNLQLLRKNLYDLIEIEIERAHFYFYHLHTIQKQYPEIDLHLLQDALLSDYHSVLDFIIQILGVAGASEDCELLSHSLRSRNPKVRSQVLETLEKTCEPQIFRILYPLIAEFPLEEKIRAYEKSGRTVLSLNELLDKMANSPIQGDQIVAIALKYKLNIPNWKETLRQQIASRNDMINHFAHELL